MRVIGWDLEAEEEGGGEIMGGVIPIFIDAYGYMLHGRGYKD